MLTAIIKSELGEVQVRIDDISAHGARVFSEALFPVDTPVTFQCKTLAVEGFVAWVDGPLAGIGFGAPIEPQMALRTVTPSRPTTLGDFRRPGFRGQSLTDDERRRLEEWARPQRPRFTD